MKLLWQAERQLDPLVDVEMYLPSVAEVPVDGFDIPREVTALYGELQAGAWLLGGRPRLLLCTQEVLQLLAQVLVTFFLMTQDHLQGPIGP